MNLIEKSLKKFEKLSKVRPLPIEVKHKAEEKINQIIQNKVSNTEVQELNSAVKNISNLTGYPSSRVMEALMKSDTKKIIMVNTEGKIFIKRNEE